ncbi:MAG: carboxypeptidase regulatory-like domain-containing protein [Elusimicrobia bacterium]|nr:carboxypeptidase regulatory-like domain-containing protein [Candidatus Liberimonas magnetica]
MNTVKKLVFTGIILCSPAVSSVYGSYAITTFAGNGIAGYSGDGGSAVSAKISYPYGVAVDTAGNVYISGCTGSINHRIRKINPSGIISNFAGTGTEDYSGDGGQATSAKLDTPRGVAVDATGNVYIVDQLNNRIRKVNTSGIISTFAGSGTAGYSGDGGQAASAKLNYPFGVAADASGNVYIADTGNFVIRKVNPSGIISTFAGNGTSGYSGDGGSASSAQLVQPVGIAADVSGNVYIADQSGNRIRKVNTSGKISTFAGNGTAGYSGDGGSADSAQLNNPQAVAVDTLGNVYISDYGNYRIRKVNTSGLIATFAGNGTAGFSGDGGSATSAQVDGPVGVAVDVSGNVYISDYTNIRVRKVFVNSETGIISGKITKSDGTTAISGVLVEVLESGVVISTATSDISGNYSITVGIGTYDVRTSLSGYQSQLKNGYSVSGGSIITINFSLTEAPSSQTGTLSCTIIASDGSAIINALIKIYQGSIPVNEGYSDPSGKCSFSLGAGSYDISVSKAGFQTKAQKGLSVTAEQTASANFSLAPAVQARTGTITCNIQCNGAVVVNAVIRITQNNDLIDVEQTDSIGTYGFSLAAGMYDINVSKTGYQTSNQTGVIVNNNQTTKVYISLLQTSQQKPQAGMQTTLGNNLFSPGAGGTCKIVYNVSQAGNVTIKICDLMGRQVRSAIDNSNYTAGSYQWDWDGKDDNGENVPSGIYILYFKYPGGTETRKIGVK